MQQPQLLPLDEPVVGMTDEETMQLAALFSGPRSTCSIMVVEHDVEFVTALAGTEGYVAVLAEGSVLTEGTPDAIKRDERVVESYLGR